MMAVVENLSKIAVRGLLANGTDSSGKLKTVNVSFPTISTTGYTMAMAFAVYDAMGDIVSKTPTGLIVTKTSSIDDE